jgi:hypothetical protein
MAGSVSMGISPHKIPSLLVFIASYFIKKTLRKSYSTLKVARVFLTPCMNYEHFTAVMFKADLNIFYLQRCTCKDLFRYRSHTVEV